MMHVYGSWNAGAALPIYPGYARRNKNLICKVMDSGLGGIFPASLVSNLPDCLPLG